MSIFNNFFLTSFRRRTQIIWLKIYRCWSLTSEVWTVSKTCLKLISSINSYRLRFKHNSIKSKLFKLNISYLNKLALFLVSIWLKSSSSNSKSSSASTNNNMFNSIRLFLCETLWPLSQRHKIQGLTCRKTTVCTVFKN